MAKICVFTQTLLSGGAEKDAVLLANSLTEKHDVYLLLFYGDRIENKLLSLLNADKVRLVKLDGNIFSKAFQICRFLKKNKIEIIFSILLLPNFYGGILGRICGVKFPLGGIKSAKLDKSKVFVNKFLQNHINKLTIYNNYKGFGYYSNKGFNENKAIVIPNVLETIPEKISRTKKERVTIVSVGRFHVAKDYFTALKAVGQLKKMDISFKYLIIGYGELEKNIRAWITEMKLENEVEVIINPQNINDYYIEADIFFLSSIFEGLPNSVLEALSFSLPVVSTRVGDIERVVIQGETGFVCDPKDYFALSEKLYVLADNFNKRIEFGLKGHGIIEKEYSFTVAKEKYLNLIDNLLET